MGLLLYSSRVCFLVLSLFVLITHASNKPNAKVFNVIDYGATSDGKTDNTEAFLKAWKEACEWEGRTWVLVPKGEYILNQLSFSGPCKGPIRFLLRGTLKPPQDPKFSENWITFASINRLVITGGGIINGEGEKAWPKNDCHKNPNCGTLPISVRLEFITNGRVKNIKSINSQNAHVSLFGCNDVEMSNMKIIAPDDSPNTDGIKIGKSKNIRISNSNIGTGDDCIAIISGSQNVDVSGVFCGPGHGISVGSMGKYPIEDVITGLNVRNCTFSGTSNGVRIKTWASPNKGLASNFTFTNIEMKNVTSPIIIDQLYCPHPPCDQTTASNIQIQDITYENIWGTSGSEVAVTFQCSKTLPCKNIVVKNIDLSYRGKPPVSNCANVYGKSYGNQKPMSCV